MISVLGVNRNVVGRILQPDIWGPQSMYLMKNEMYWTIYTIRMETK